MNRNKVSVAPSPSNVDDSSFRTKEPSANGSNAESVRLAEKELVSKLVKTQRAIRRVDLFTAFCAVATLALGILFLGILCDSWLLSAGLSIRGRVFFILLLFIVSLLCFLWKLAPILRRRVSTLYAAKILEETQQDRHNLTINWLQLCRGGSLNSDSTSTSTLHSEETDKQAEATRRAVLQNVALQAARHANCARFEATVDCSSLIRWGIAFASLVLLGSVYVVLSPKSPFESAGRIIAPFANIDRPQALRFESVVPGDVDVFQGDVLEVEATIPGAKSSETVEILWSTEDGRMTDVAIPMKSSSPSRFRSSFPDGDEGFNENLLYKVVAGRGTPFESASDLYVATVRPQPSFRVVKTTLIFPKYAGLTPQTFDDQGDVRAVEGASVEVVARANEKISRAYLLPDGDQTRAIKMEISATEPEIATASFTLQWKESESQDKIPEFSTYSLQSEDVNGEKNRDSRIYTVSILPDLPPTIEWESEESDTLQVPLNDVLHVQFSAEDPDYSLRRVLLHVAYGNLNQGVQADQKPDPKPIELPLSNSPNTLVNSDDPTPFVGSLTLSYPLVPEKLGLSVGDELEYWGVAVDSKFPNPNVSASEKRVFVVVDPVDNPNAPNAEDSDKNQSKDAEDKQAPGASQGGSSSSNDRQDGNGNSENGTGNEEQQSEQGESSDNQPESSGQEGEESETESNASDGAASESGKNSSGNDESQEQESEGQNGGNSEGQNGGNSEGQNGGSKGSSDGSESKQSAGQKNSDSNDSSNDPSDKQSEETEGGASSHIGETEELKSENASASDKPQESAPPENATSAEDTFQKILNFMNQQQQEESNASSALESADEERSDGASTEQNGSRQSSHASDAPSDLKDEVDPDFDPSEELGVPQEKRELPKRTSVEKPEKDSSVYQAENVDKVDQNTRRRQGDVDPNENNFLAQNADPNQPETRQSDKKRNDANIMLDPLDQSQGTAADAIDRNSPEAKGGANVPEGGASEVDPDAKQDPNRPSTPDQDQAQNNHNPSGEGGDASGADDVQSKQNDSQNADEGAGASKKRNPSNKNNASPSDGSSDNNGVVHGGGGAGAGNGDLEQGEEQLAPADAPRLQYAEQATNLVLEYLEDSLKNKLDKRLLNELGLTEAEMRAFLEKWKKMREAAIQDDGLNRDKYLEALGKIGFDEYETLEDSDSVDFVLERSVDNGRNRTGSREASRLKTPDRLSERVRAFTRGVSTGTRLP